jgi:hypothetical protein
MTRSRFRSALDGSSLCAAVHWSRTARLLGTGKLDYVSVTQLASALAWASLSGLREGETPPCQSVCGR